MLRFDAGNINVLYLIYTQLLRMHVSPNYILFLFVWMFLILLIYMLQGYFLENRTNFDSVDKLLPVSNMASSGLKKMLDLIILYTLKSVSENVFPYNFVFDAK